MALILLPCYALYFCIFTNFCSFGYLPGHQKGVPRSCFPPFWALLGATWAPPGPFRKPLVPLLELQGASWSIWGSILPLSGHFGAHFWYIFGSFLVHSSSLSSSSALLSPSLSSSSQSSSSSSTSSPSSSPSPSSSSSSVYVVISSGAPGGFSFSFSNSFSFSLSFSN